MTKSETYFGFKPLRDHEYIKRNIRLNKQKSPKEKNGYDSFSMIPSSLQTHHAMCIPRRNDVKTVVSTSFQCGIHVVCMWDGNNKCKGLVIIH